VDPIYSVVSRPKSHDGRTGTRGGRRQKPVERKRRNVRTAKRTVFRKTGRKKYCLPYFANLTQMLRRSMEKGRRIQKKEAKGGLRGLLGKGEQVVWKKRKNSSPTEVRILSVTWNRGPADQKGPIRAGIRTRDVVDNMEKSWRKNEGRGRRDSI